MNRPNDVVVKSDGAIYFSDPNGNVVPDQTDLTYAGVYRVSPDLGTLTLLVNDFLTPKVPSGMWLEFLRGVISGKLTIAYYAARSIGGSS